MNFSSKWFVVFWGSECKPYVPPDPYVVGTCTNVTTETSCTLGCKTGYDMVGDMMITCKVDGHFTELDGGRCESNNVVLHDRV